MNKQEILEEIAELKDRLNNLEKMCDSLTSSNKRWRADKDCMYFYIDSEDEICSSLENGATTDNLRYDIGNYFQTEEEAIFEVERLKVIAELKEWATPISEFNWEDFSKRKYMLEIKGMGDLAVAFYYCSIQTSDLCFESEEVAKRAIEAVGEERIIKYYFRRGESNANSN